MDTFSYKRYSDFLRRKYDTRVYKLAIHLPLTCPNRDGLLGYGGCIYCNDEGAGFETTTAPFPVSFERGGVLDAPFSVPFVEDDKQDDLFSVSKQIEIGKQKMIKMYKAEKFVAYFQSFTNTYMPIEQFKRYMEEAAECGVVEIAVATRPDCVSDEYLTALKEVCDKYGIYATIELGLQTVNYHTLKKINRGHTLAEYIDAVLRIKKYDFDICTHVILNLPWDNMDDVIETSKIISTLGITHVKLHALYILKNTAIAKMYEKKEFEMISVEEYMERVIVFLEYLDPRITLQRIIGRAPEDSSVFTNWGMSWWKIHDEIQEIIKKDGRQQGRLFNYLNGSAVRGMQK